MSAMFSTITIFTIGVLCSPIGAEMTPPKGDQTISSNTGVEIPGYIHAEGRCIFMMHCFQVNWDSSKHREKGVPWTRAVCTLQDCFKLCQENSPCKVFEFYKMSDGTGYYCTIFPTLSHCGSALIKGKGEGAHTPIFTYVRNGKPLDPSTFSKTTGSCGSKSLTPIQLVKLGHIKCRSCFAMMWANQTYQEIKHDHSKDKHKTTAKVPETPTPSKIRSMSDVAIRPNDDERVNVNITSNRVIKSKVPDPTERNECLKNLDAEKEKNLQAMEQFIKMAEAMCMDAYSYHPDAYYFNEH